MTNHPASHADLPSLLELAEVVATCIPFLPAAGQKNIGRVVEQLVLITQAGPEWMPIDSAPRDGTWVLIFEEWNAEKPHKNWTISRFHNGKWSYRQTFGPTHWLPLPPPPKESE